jgi:hypothetical protein
LHLPRPVHDERDAADQKCGSHSMNTPGARTSMTSSTPPAMSQSHTPSVAKKVNMASVLTA